MKWQASAPANIALIKYMGKTDIETNTPSNASLSYTLEGLKSLVELETTDADKDHWEALPQENAQNIQLNFKGKQRFLTHLGNLKKFFNYKKSFVVRSSNNFPADCGLASSASSFAALTKCAVTTLSDLTNHPRLSIKEQAKLSQQASGSSCRSFFSPWALWNEEGASAVDIPFEKLIHLGIIVDKDKKKPSSSEAHTRVLTSSLYADRVRRAHERLDLLIKAFQENNWFYAYQICWQEFWDMHALFETSKPAFGYMTPKSLAVLKEIREYWQFNNDGPIATMDAGPNIHLLFREDQKDMANYFKAKFAASYLVI